MLPHILPAFAAISDAATSASSSRATSLLEFPGELPTDKELSDWLDNVLPTMRSVFGAVIRGQTPAHLSQFESGADDLTGYVQIAAGTDGQIGRAHV